MLLLSLLILGPSELVVAKGRIWVVLGVQKPLKLSNQFLNGTVLFLGHISLKDEEFYSTSLKEYFLYWCPLTSIELLSEVSAVEQSLEKYERYYEAKPFVDEYTVNDVVHRRVILNFHGSEQPYKPENGLTLSWNKEMKRQPIFFAEMNEMIGMSVSLFLGHF